MKEYSFTVTFADGIKRSFGADTPGIALAMGNLFLGGERGAITVYAIENGVASPIIDYLQ